VFVAPATPKNHALVRFTLQAGLSREDLDRLIQVCAEIREEVGFSQWASTLALQKAQPATRASKVG
jgi:CAI-1 autoinducer synthase